MTKPAAQNTTDQTQSTIAYVPLDKLIPSQANVRKTHNANGFAELAASIKSVGLLQDDSVELRATLHAGPAAIAAHRAKHLAVEPASALEAQRHRDERAQLAAPDQGRCYRVRGGFQIPRH